jgi:hypothetical protein
LGERWRDIPTEALVAIADPLPQLLELWSFLLGEDSAGIRRLIRVLGLRHKPEGVIDALVADPVVAQLIDQGTPPGLERRGGGPDPGLVDRPRPAPDARGSPDARRPWQKDRRSM